MKFTLPDSAGCWQEITITDGERAGDVKIDLKICQEVDDVLSENAQVRRDGQRRYMGEGDNTTMMLLGRLSTLQAHELIKQGIFWDDQALRKWLRNLDNYLWGVMKGTTPRYFEVKHVQGSQDQGGRAA